MAGSATHDSWNARWRVRGLTSILKQSKKPAQRDCGMPTAAPRWPMASWRNWTMRCSRFSMHPTDGLSTRTGLGDTCCTDFRTWSSIAQPRLVSRSLPWPTLDATPAIGKPGQYSQELPVPVRRRRGRCQSLIRLGHATLIAPVARRFAAVTAGRLPGQAGLGLSSGVWGDCLARPPRRPGHQ